MGLTLYNDAGKVKGSQGGMGKQTKASSFWKQEGGSS